MNELPPFFCTAVNVEHEMLIEPLVNKYIQSQKSFMKDARCPIISTHAIVLCPSATCPYDEVSVFILSLICVAALSALMSLAGFMEVVYAVCLMEEVTRRVLPSFPLELFEPRKRNRESWRAETCNCFILSLQTTAFAPLMNSRANDGAFVVCRYQLATYSCLVLSRTFRETKRKCYTSIPFNFFYMNSKQKL